MSARSTTKSGPRGAAAAVKRRSLKSSQGGQLPEDGSPISAYPVGCCVLLGAPLGTEGGSTDGGIEPAWFLIRFCIGGSGAPHVGRLSAPPDRPGWNARMGYATSAPAGTIVLCSCWPYRASAPDDERGESGDSDPLAAAPADGSLMLSHLRSTREGGDTVDDGELPAHAPPRPHEARVSPGLARGT